MKDGLVGTRREKIGEWEALWTILMSGSGYDTKEGKRMGELEEEQRDKQIEVAYVYVRTDKKIIRGF